MVDKAVGDYGKVVVDGNGRTVYVFDNTANVTVSPSAPVSPGEVITIYCTGLGAVEPSGLAPGASSIQPEAGQATAGRPRVSVTPPPVMDTSMIRRWFSRLTIRSGMPWSDRVTAADEAADQVRHPDGEACFETFADIYQQGISGIGLKPARRARTSPSIQIR